uniref:Uncharacterized protein n=1 Tax=Anguilla anguilla TaxID=7936 RepID=A0A0E9TM55_ANGAN
MQRTNYPMGLNNVLSYCKAGDARTTPAPILHTPA